MIYNHTFANSIALADQQKINTQGLLKTAELKLQTGYKVIVDKGGNTQTDGR